MIRWLRERDHRWRRPAPAILVLAAIAIAALVKGGTLVHTLATAGDQTDLGDWPDDPSAAAIPHLPEPAAGPDDPNDPSAAGDPVAPGPGASATATDPPGSEDSATEPSAMSVAALGAENLTSSEIAILHQLAARRAQLDERERQLRTQVTLLETAEAKLASQTERLERLRAEIDALINQHDEKEEAKLASLVKIYEAMKPKAAAEIFNRLEMPVLLQVVERMREPKSADVLARMDPKRAKQVTAELAKRTPLPPLDGDA